MMWSIFQEKFEVAEFEIKSPGVEQGLSLGLESRVWIGDLEPTG
jgi:hypothetical protein